MHKVARAEIIARVAHLHQVDKSGVDYSEHLRAVSELTKSAIDPTWKYREDAIAAAWLHDTIEDTPLSLHDLRELGMSEATVNAVALLTHTHEHSHEDYIRAIRDADGIAGTIARIVKVADLKHNASPERSVWMPANSLANRYEKAMAILSDKEA